MKFFLLAIVIILCTSCGIYSSDHIGKVMPNESDVTSNNTPDVKEDLSEPQYSSQELINLGFDGELSVEYIKDNYRIDAERKFDRGIGYIMIIAEDGGRFYLAFTEDEENNINRREYWYCGKKVLSEDFDVLTIGTSTYDDVISIDPYGDDFDLYRSYLGVPYRSYHTTYDGYYFIITYEINDNAVVSEIQKEKAPDDALINLILDEDMPEW